MKANLSMICSALPIGQNKLIVVFVMTKEVTNRVKAAIILCEHRHFYLISKMMFFNPLPPAPPTILLGLSFERSFGQNIVSTQ